MRAWVMLWESDKELIFWKVLEIWSEKKQLIDIHLQLIFMSTNFVPQSTEYFHMDYLPRI